MTKYFLVLLLYIMAPVNTMIARTAQISQEGTPILMNEKIDNPIGVHGEPTPATGLSTPPTVIKWFGTAVPGCDET